MTSEPIASRLARYALGSSADDLPTEVVACVRQRLLDSLACAVGAYDAPPVDAAIAVARAVPVPGSTILGTRMQTTPDLAAFTNGVMVRFLDYNDGYMAREPGHPSDSIPACLALAEAQSLPGAELVAAIVVAYEVQMRLQDAAGLNKRGWDHVNYVNVAVAAAAARLLMLDQTQAEHAINLALSGHVSMRQVRTGALSDWKGCSAANAARNAVFAAQLASYGMTGPSPIFEGDAGFFAQVSGRFELDVDAFGTCENGDFAIMRSLTKTFPTNGELHTAVWAAIGLRPSIPHLDDIESILIETSEFNRRVLADAAKWQPATRETADHSLAYNVARALIDGDIDLGSYSAEKIRDPRVRILMDTTTVEEDTALTALFPRHLANRVTVKLRSGERISKEVISGPGSVETPMTDADFERKFRRTADSHISAAAQDVVVDFTATLERQAGYGELFRAMERTLLPF
ncbi:MmgE/PrpD family protein [Microbacterium sp. HD4P20]|uniref:MmgE/PrpD family protein n=1 Tax=Microbacterium sp. HD4P20 TaxID=2864874 RepID=UPI001C63E04E|nr:MmgE/PrpD family protein [Microbacterium sp. HD4P20]MCP2636295.1 MmgE/PrpD family protein [Microbacterium sp. HD4P20]